MRRRSSYVESIGARVRGSLPRYRRTITPAWQIKETHGPLLHLITPCRRSRLSSSKAVTPASLGRRSDGPDSAMRRTSASLSMRAIFFRDPHFARRTRRLSKHRDACRKLTAELKGSTARALTPHENHESHESGEHKAVPSAFEMTPDSAAAILNVERDADGATIRAAFKLRSRMWHPDRFAGGTQRERAEAAIEFIRVTTAFEVLSSAPCQWEVKIETPPSSAADVEPQGRAGGETTARSSLREYLGLGTSATGLREYTGFGSPSR